MSHARSRVIQPYSDCLYVCTTNAQTNRLMRYVSVRDYSTYGVSHAFYYYCYFVFY